MHRVPWAVSVDEAPAEKRASGVKKKRTQADRHELSKNAQRLHRFFFLDTPPGWERRSICSPSLVLANVDEGSSADGCSGPDGEGEGKRDWLLLLLLLLLVSLLKTGDGLLPLLWIGVEVQSSPGCFFWMSE